MVNELHDENIDAQVEKTIDIICIVLLENNNLTSLEIIKKCCYDKRVKQLLAPIGSVLINLISKGFIEKHLFIDNQLGKKYFYVPTLESNWRGFLARRRMLENNVTSSFLKEEINNKN